MGHGDWKDMFRAVEENNIELVRYYISKGIDINYQHPEYMTGALFESTRRNNIEISRLLLENGASPSAREAFSSITPISIAKELKLHEMLQLLLSFKS